MWALSSHYLLKPKETVLTSHAIKIGYLNKLSRSLEKYGREKPSHAIKVDYLNKLSRSSEEYGREKPSQISTMITATRSSIGRNSRSG